MATGGHTTVIQRVLERRAAKPATTEEGTTATVAVMVRVLPPPKALLVFQDAPLRQHMQRRITPDVLECEAVADDEATANDCGGGMHIRPPRWASWPRCRAASATRTR